MILDVQLGQEGPNFCKVLKSKTRSDFKTDVGSSQNCEDDLTLAVTRQ